MSISTGHIINQRYRIVKTITQGGFGRLYRAWDLSLKRPVALKQNLDDTQVGREQFETEALILADLHHPNLARVTDYFYAPDVGQFLVMDYVEGEDLQSMIDRSGPLSEEQAVVWINQVCDALVYIHNQKPPIIHRDIKPANIRITPAGRAMLVDFGIAKSYSPDKVTVTGARAVTPGYAPVEQYGSARTDARSDIYAVGATLYALLTGKEPPESINLVSGANLPRLRSINVHISPSIDEAVHVAMALQPADRFQNVPAFQAALSHQVTTKLSYNRWLPKVTLIFFAILALIDLAVALSGFMQFSIISRIIQGEEISASVISNYDRIHQWTSIIQIFIWVITSIIFLVWITVSSSQLSKLVQNFKYSSMWVILGFFVPFYNLIHPYLVIKEIWRVSNLQVETPPGMQRSTGSGILIFWWFVSLLSFALIGISVFFSSSASSLNEFRFGGLMYLIAYLINAVAAGFTILIINKTNQLQETTFEQQQVIRRTKPI